MARRLYFLAGEASGDGHGASLLRALRDLDPALEFVGRGGRKMQEVAGEALRNWTAEAAVLGLWEVVKRYGYFRREFRAALREIDAAKPDAVVLIDYPGFNLRLARALRQRRTTAKIIYYISPQVWAWNRRRIPQMARSLDLMLCIFPFEADLYNRSGLRTIFVGHPMTEHLGPQRDERAREPNLVGLFPGSRMREVRAIFPLMIETAARMLQTHSDLRFEVAAASEELAAEVETILRRGGQQHHFTIITGGAASLMQRAAVGIVASGTATLEAAYFRLSFVLVYKVAWPTYLAARMVVNVKHLGMPNVLAGREIVREFIQHSADPAQIAAATLRLIDDASARETLLAEFDAIVAQLGQSGASANAARAILDELGGAPATER